jgi:predicted glycosyltransferase involved in capsule biosynthesis
MENKIDLTDCTFIIPVKLDSEDREQNFRFVMKYLHDKFKTNIIITESYHNDDLILQKEYADVLEKNNVTLIEKPNEKYFRRTHYLNEMLKKSKTKITINYDLDVFLPIHNYWESKQMIYEGFDLVYPFSKGKFQLEVPEKYRDELIKENIIKIDMKRLLLNLAEYGHAQFFNTDSYKKGFGENEEFISFGPEDQERYYRFKTLGYNISHLNNRYVFHLNHSRGRDSSRHKHYSTNLSLWEKIQKMNKEELIKYYKTLQYTKKL